MKVLSVLLFLTFLATPLAAAQPSVSNSTQATETPGGIDEEASGTSSLPIPTVTISTGAVPTGAPRNGTIGSAPPQPTSGPGSSNSTASAGWPRTSYNTTSSAANGGSFQNAGEHAAYTSSLAVFFLAAATAVRAVAPA